MVARQEKVIGLFLSVVFCYTDVNFLFRRAVQKQRLNESSGRVGEALAVPTLLRLLRPFFLDRCMCSKCIHSSQ